MEPETKNSTEETTSDKSHNPGLIHTYESDLSKSMDVTDATVIQEVISSGKAREARELELSQIRRQKVWYNTGSIILIVCTLGALVYTFFYYRSLSVPAQKSVTVGVFPTTEPILVSSSDIRKTVETLLSKPNLDNNKPLLSTMVSDEKSLSLLTTKEMFSFFESTTTETFADIFTLIRLGVVKTDQGQSTFIVASTKDAEVATKELLVSEPTLLQMFYKPLNIDLSSHTKEIGVGFNNDFLHNIPVRILKYKDLENKDVPLLIYAQMPNNTIVFTTKTEALKAVYDQIIQQQ